MNLIIKTFIIAMSFIVMGLFGLNSVIAEDNNQSKITKVTIAYLYNFIRYVEWPELTFTSDDSDFRVCYYDVKETLLTSLFTLQRKKKSSHQIVVKEYSQDADCHVVFSGTDEASMDSFISSVQGNNILTVSNVKGFAQKGGMIELTKSRKKIRFTINKSALKQSQLKVSSKLMRLANVIE